MRRPTLLAPLCMPEGRPKLLLLTGPNVSADGWSRLLSTVYDITAVDRALALDAMRLTDFNAVVTETGDLLVLERELARQQSTVLLNALGEGVCLIDASGRVVWCNPRFAAYDEPTRGRIAAVCRQAAITSQSPTPAGSGAGPAPGATAAPLADRISPPPLGSGPGVGGAVGGAAAGSAGLRPSRRYEVANADDSRFFEVLVSVVDEPGASVSPSTRRAAAIVWEVTTARRQQVRQNALDSAGEELVRLDAEVIRKLSAIERLRVLEEKIVRFAHDLLHFDHFAIRRLDERTAKLELIIAKGLPSAAMEVELYARRENNGISGYVAATGRSYICPDTTKDPRYVTGIDLARSSLTVPLRLHGRVIGIFNVESTRVNAFGEEDRVYAEHFARHIALALHILDLLVVERSNTAQTVSGTVEGEISEPLDDLTQVAARMRAAQADPQVVRLIERILADVDSIKRRVKDAASGPRNVLGADRALADVTVDPVIAGKRILVVDDEPRIRQVVRDVLRGKGADVVMCEDGAGAVEVLSRARGGPEDGEAATPVASTAMPGQERTIGLGPETAQPRRFDLLISDIRLPDKTGYEIFSAARKVNQGLPVILMTGFGYDPHHSIVRASQEGLSSVLFKPFQAERLLEEVRKALSIAK